MRARVVLVSVVVVGSVAGIACLFGREEPRPPVSHNTPGVPKLTAARSASKGEATAEVRGELVSSEASAAAAAFVTKLFESQAPKLAAHRVASDRDELARELLDFARSPRRGQPMVELRVGLERLLRERPELAPAVAKAFARADDRETLFVFSRALATCGDDASVRAALLEGAAPGQLEARREVALMALAGTGDPKALELERTSLADAAAPAAVRAAAAYALAQDWDRLAPAEAAAAAGDARRLASSPNETERLRAESFYLLARSSAHADAGADLALARATLGESSVPDEVALAAARLALERGEPRAAVATALRTHSRGAGDLLARAAAQLTRIDGEGKRGS